MFKKLWNCKFYMGNYWYQQTQIGIFCLCLLTTALYFFREECWWLLRCIRTAHSMSISMLGRHLINLFFKHKGLLTNIKKKTDKIYFFKAKRYIFMWFSNAYHTYRITYLHSIFKFIFKWTASIYIQSKILSPTKLLYLFTKWEEASFILNKWIMFSPR